jgi:uncharacterized membrane protein YgdD (TMEM256/DUF423 family)
MSPSGRRFVGAGALLAMLSVAAGAFAAHGLQRHLSAEMLAVFETAARYQMYHALALILAGLLEREESNRWIRFAAWSFIAGIALFSGSLYVLALSNTRFWGAVTPFGGTAFLAGWLGLFLALWPRRDPP